ncbi:MAG: O-antigen ligase domain-containing protein, partial [Chitinophagaceae bacterium]
MKKRRVLQFIMVGSIVLSPCLYLNIAWLRENREAAEALYRLMLGCLLLLNNMFSKTTYQLNNVENVSAISCVYYLCRQLFQILPDYAGAFNTLLVMLVYGMVRQMCNEFGWGIGKWISHWLYLVMGIYFVVGLANFLEEASFLYQYHPNPSVGGVVVAVQLVFLIIWWYVHPAGDRRWQRFQIMLCVAMMVVLIYTRSRSGWIGFAAAMVIFRDRLVRRTKNRLLQRLVGILIMVMMLVFSLQFKTGSSAGRLLIYQVSGEILADHWLWGIGSGNFSRFYGIYQARHFEFSGIDSAQALSADHVSYAFNDLLQFVIEAGMPGLCVLMMGIYLFIKHIRTVLKSIEGKRLIFSLAMLAAIGCSSFFIYSLHHLPVLLLVLLALAFLNASRIEDEQTKAKPGRLWLMLPCLALIVYSAHEYSFYQKVKLARQLARAGLV